MARHHEQTTRLVKVDIHTILPLLRLMPRLQPSDTSL
jgi:hypothetical protein